MRVVTISYVNFWHNFDANTSILHGYLRHAFAQQEMELQIRQGNLDAEIVCASVYASIDHVTVYRNAFRILFTGENHHNSRIYQNYDNDAIVRSVFDVYIGFDREEDEVKMRIPLSILYFRFYEKEACPRYQQIRANVPPIFATRTRPATLVARSDLHRNRSHLLRLCTAAGIHVDCPSSLGHNCPGIEERNLDKVTFLESYLFNLCPENSLRDGYVTEKLLEATLAGCIPVYTGDLAIEPWYRRERILLFANPTEVVPRMRDLLDNPPLLREMFEQPVFTEDAIEWIDHYIDKFHRIPTKFLAKKPPPRG